MSASPALITRTGWATSPVIDYEPAPAGPGRPRPGSGALHASTARERRAVAPPQEVLPPRSAMMFADTALRQVIEVIDRRRPVAALRPLLAPVLIDRVLARAGTAQAGSATGLRVRTRSVYPVADPCTTRPAEVVAAEVFATFQRAGRVHAAAGRIERHGDRWRIVALQIG